MTSRIIREVCGQGAENAHGPRIVRSCRDSRDFTIFFEDAALAIILSTAFISTGLIRAAHLFRQRRKALLRLGVFTFQNVKIFSIVALMAVQIVCALRWLPFKSEANKLALAASLFTITSSICLAILSYFEHDRSISPSSVIMVYLLVSGLCDILTLRTLWLSEDDVGVLMTRTSTLFLKTIIFTLESKNKRNFLDAQYRNTSPEALAGILGRSFFWWLIPTLNRGYYVSLELDDLPHLDPKLSVPRLQARFSQVWKRWPKSKGKHLLLSATFTCFRGRLLAPVLPRLFTIVCKFSQPLLIERAVTLLGETNEGNRVDSGIMLISAATIVYVGIALGTATYKHKIYRAMVSFRSGLIGVIHDSSLSVDLVNTKKVSAVTLMSTDVDRIIAGIEMLDVIWATPIEVALAISMLGRQLGWACLSPLCISVGCAIASVQIGKLATKYQKTWIDSIQQRVTATSNFLNNIKSIKMMGMTGLLAEGLQQRRMVEIQLSQSYRKVDTVQQAIGNTTLVITPVTTFLLYYILARHNGEENLDPTKAFTSLSLISLLSYPILYFVFAVPRFTGSIGCYDRIQACLISQEKAVESTLEEDGFEIEIIPSDSESAEIELESLLPKRALKRSIKSNWMEVKNIESSSIHTENPNSNLIQIENANFSFHMGSESILHQVSLNVGRGEQLLFIGPTGSGKSSLFLAILGELHQNQGAIHRKPSLGVAFCAQEPWLPSASIQDSILGPSSLDQAWLAEVIAACDLGQDIANLSEKEHSLVGSNGASLSGGQKQRLSLARALYARKEVLLLDDVFSWLDLATERIVAQNVLGPNGFCKRHGLTVLMTTHAPKSIEYFDAYYSLEAGGTLSQRIIDIFPSVEREEKSKGEPKEVQHNPEIQFLGSRGNTPQAGNVQPTFGTGVELYKYFFSRMGWGSISMVSTASAIFVFCFKFPDVWLKWWTESQNHDSVKLYLIVYLLLAAVALVALVSFSWSLKMIAVPRTAASLHQALLSTVVSAPYYFLISTGPGNIVNRFSEDLSVIDLQLTLALAKSIDGLFTIVAEASLVAFASPLTILAFPPLVAVIWILQKIYLPTSRQIRLLEIEARAPLYSHFLETLAGLVTIRAFAWQRHWVQRQRDALDRSQRALYMTYCTQRWLNLVLDLIVAGIGVTIMVLVTQVPSHSTDGGALGVSLTNIVTFSATLTYVIQGWAQLETSMGAVQRVRDFTEQTPSENNSGESRQLALDPASPGIAIRFDGVTAAYSNSSCAVLNNVTFQIPAGQKVGVCGRTGSGKSTLLLTLLRLGEVLGGSITVAGNDILHFERDSIRKSITVIPQDPALFPGSLRYNLDPENLHSDTELLNAISRVGLKDIISSPQGINTDMAQSTASLSRGELQLLALARALLQRHKKGSLLVMDEITSSTDAMTEETIMRIVKEDFAKSTVIAVAHRLDTILDFDLVLVMDQGRLKEVGRPKDLLKRSDSLFTRLYMS